MQVKQETAKTWAVSVFGHGRLRDPPCRASMWRDGYDTPVDYNDNELFCGGFIHQWEELGGLCGICGDPYDESPRQHEAPGGTWANTGIITREYEAGSWVNVSVEVTTQHKGFFEFKICPTNDFTQDKDQDCFDEIGALLTSSGTTHYPMTTWDEGIWNITVQLPADVTCEQCVFQWRWTTGNSWGTCENGTSAVGCGPQETFMGCADVAIKQKYLY